MTWSSIGDMLEKKYQITLHDNNPDCPDFAAFRLPVDPRNGVYADGYLNYIDGVIALATTIDGNKECLEELFPGMVDNFKQTLGKSKIDCKNTNCCLVIVFYDDGEEELAQNALKSYL